MSNAEAVTDATFDDVVLKSDKPVLVDFWAEGAVPAGRSRRSSTRSPRSTATRSPWSRSTPTPTPRSSVSTRSPASRCSRSSPVARWSSRSSVPSRSRSCSASSPSGSAELHKPVDATVPAPFGVGPGSHPAVGAVPWSYPYRRDHAEPHAPAMLEAPLKPSIMQNRSANPRAHAYPIQVIMQNRTPNSRAHAYPTPA